MRLVSSGSLNPDAGLTASGRTVRPVFLVCQAVIMVVGRGVEIFGIHVARAARQRE